MSELIPIAPKTAEEWVPRIQRRWSTTVEAVIEIGREFQAARKALSSSEFARLANLVGFSDRTIRVFIQIATNEIIVKRHLSATLPCSWRTLYELIRLDPPRLQLAIDRGEVSPLLTQVDAQKLVKEYRTIDIGDVVTSEPSKPAATIELELERVSEPATKQAEPKPAPPKTATFNQVNDNIGWAKWSWNVVTGCLHNCDYCYARDIANRFYPQKFEPTFFPERLDAPANTKLPKDADGDPAWRRVFTCSMADLFGKWVKQAWIKAVFERIDEHREWEFLCLTKFPQRLAELNWPPNVWAGTTVDRQHRVETAERSFAKVKAGVKWLSCEPLLEPLKFNSLAMFDWVVIGASTGSTLAAPFAPPFEWVADLYQQARASGCKVYLKHNLFGSEDGRTPGMQATHEWPR
jgi:protein gp37